MEENVVKQEVVEETVQQPAWEVVPEPMDIDAMEEKLENAEETLEEEVKKGFCAAKEWLHNALYEAGRVFREHKKAVLTIVAIVVALGAAAAALWAFLKKE